MNFPQNVVCVCQDKAWKDSSTMLKWVELVYKPYVDTIFFSLFALDKVSPWTCGITVDNRIFNNCQVWSWENGQEAL